MLAIELQGLLEIDLDFDVTLTGLEMGEIDVLIGEYEIEEEVDPADRFTGLTDGPPVTRPRDIWRIGKHRLICGDATDHDTFDRLIDGSRAQMVLTDPPYNVPVDGHVCGLGNVKHREFDMAVGEMTEGQFTSFLSSAFENLANFCTEGAIHFICMD